jgi:hypothetical protein
MFEAREFNSSPEYYPRNGIVGCTVTRTREEAEQVRYRASFNRPHSYVVIIDIGDPDEGIGVGRLRLGQLTDEGDPS